MTSEKPTLNERELFVFMQNQDVEIVYGNLECGVFNQEGNLTSFSSQALAQAILEHFAVPSA